MSSPNPLNTALDGIKAAVPIVLGYVPIGFAAGVVGAQAGLSPLEMCLLSLLVFAGSAQFIFASLVGAGTPALTIIVTVFLVNLRHLLYSTVVAERLRKVPLIQRILVGAQLTDESFALSSVLHPHAYNTAIGMIFLNVTAYFSWLLSTTSGAILGKGEWIQNIGAEFFLVAMFAALIMLTINGSSQKRRQLWVMLIATALVVLLELFYSHSLNILIVSVIAAMAGAMLFSSKDSNEQEVKKGH